MGEWLIGGVEVAVVLEDGVWPLVHPCLVTAGETDNFGPGDCVFAVLVHQVGGQIRDGVSNGDQPHTEGADTLGVHILCLKMHYCFSDGKAVFNQEVILRHTHFLRPTRGVGQAGYPRLEKHFMSEVLVEC